MPKADDHSDLKAPDQAAIQTIADAAFADLPEAFRSLCGEIVIQVADFPADDVLRELGAESPFDILGLFQGIGLAQGGGIEGMFAAGHEPNLIWLYRRPILDYWTEHHETLGAIVSHVLIHEIGHHFGLSDEDMEAIEARAGDA
ncbi:metallopeptidase family protein [Saliniramus sp.]|uniref:metallopeptidase family protein n=1 Tax=Saliniramus sp. TaxID=2986772 RepID=UPI002B9E25CE|nr:metallopeptidase family protein [Saliniramus sp.]HMB09782.1 metallopeptidase family protein [Saliniramus sp.]